MISSIHVQLLLLLLLTVILILQCGWWTLRRWWWRRQRASASTGKGMECGACDVPVRWERSITPGVCRSRSRARSLNAIRHPLVTYQRCVWNKSLGPAAPLYTTNRIFSLQAWVQNFFTTVSKLRYYFSYQQQLQLRTVTCATISPWFSDIVYDFTRSVIVTCTSGNCYYIRNEIAVD